MTPDITSFLSSSPLAPGATSLQTQIYTRIRQSIAEGRLAPGARVPATRVLANELGIARGTVESAYARLMGEGYLLTRGSAGTIVSPAVQRYPQRFPHTPETESRFVTKPQPAPIPFRMGMPALDRFPRKLWARLTAQAARQMSGAALAYVEPTGLPALRKEIATYLDVSRGVACSPEQLIVTGGYQGAISLLARHLLQPGDAVWFEDPGYVLARRALESAGARLVPVPVDAEGLRVDIGLSLAPHARLAVVTPTHQCPLGVTLSLPRRQALLEWATQSDAWIIEDDYDSELHYLDRKPPALKSLDLADRVIYVGSFSKTLFPGLRLGYVVLPHALVSDMTTAVLIERRGEPILGQAVVAEFMSQGHFARHLKRMRTLYARRKVVLADALIDTFGARMQLAPQDGGMYLLARLPGAGNDTELEQRALARHLAPRALSGFYLRGEPEQGLLLGFTNIPEEKAQGYAEALRDAIYR